MPLMPLAFPGVSLRVPPSGDPRLEPVDRSGIPSPAVKRLCLYLRELEAVMELGRRTVSSKQLGVALGQTDAQVRKDLAYFGQFGRPGIGYAVDSLVGELRRVLGTDQAWNVALVGAGNLGRALIAHGGFERKGFRIVAVFDADPALVGKPLHGRIIRPVDDTLPGTIRKEGVRLAILAVPAAAAQPVCDRLVAAGVEGILNFAPRRLTVPEKVAVVSVDLAVQLEQLAFQVSISKGGGGR